MRKYPLQQMLGKAWKLGIDLELGTRREEREALQQALHVGIGALEALEPEPVGDLGILLGEFRTHGAEELELAVVEA